MTGKLQIALEPAKPLPAEHEAQLLQDVLARNPASPTIRNRLANLLNELDRFSETVALLAPSLDSLDGEASLLLAQACFAMNDTWHLEAAASAADHALQIADNDSSRARAMADQAKVRLRLGKQDESIAILENALMLDRQCRAAFKRLGVQLLRQNRADALEALTGELLAGGICHSRILAARTIALAALGRDEEARSLAGDGQFLHRTTLTPPNSYQTAFEFNAALIAELTCDPALRQDRFGTASLHTGRLDAPSESRNPLWRLLLEAIKRGVEAWADSLPSISHPWLAARPERAVLRSWCVMTGPEGFERWHMHPDGWLSGGYYPAMPLQSDAQAKKSGSISFGLPDGLAGATAAKRFGQRAIRPDGGDLILFPSHIYHRTYPHGTTQQRICVAFDITPV